MIRIAITALCLFNLTVMHIGANEIREAKSPTWTGVDIVTNDSRARDIARKIIKIQAGQVISYYDPVLQIHCDNVRNMLPFFDVRCRAIQMEGGFALYAVDVETKKPAVGRIHIQCDPERLQTDLIDLAKSYYDAQLHELSTGGDLLGEFINQDGYLDFRGHAGHKLHTSTHLAVRGRFADLTRGVKSCVASDRADAIWLMNFSGLPRQTVDSALQLLEDSDGVVRNNASRTVTSFVEYLPDSKADALLEHSCRKIAEEDFFERNKGLSMAASIMKIMATHGKTPKITCMELVSEIALHSNSAQIGASAAWIKQLAGDQQSAGTPDLPAPSAASVPQRQQ